jgi:Kef-type K+ transport system membrane component KefB
LKISIVLAVGLLGGKLANLVKLPNVSGYLVVGLLLGPSFFNLVSPTDAKSLEIISELALAFIAFSIGSEFVLKDMKEYGKKIFIITIAEVIGAILVVFSVMYFIFRKDFAFSIVIASMSAATAPAATLLVIRQYRANGPLTRTILPVVALDDIFGIMAFGIAITLAKMSVSGIKPSFISLVADLSVEIFGSLIAGLVIGLVLTVVLRKIKGNDDYQVASLIAIGLGVGVSNLLGLSPLLTNIMIGTTLVNLLRRPDKAFKSVNNFVPAFYVLFFTLAGASLDLSILKSIGLIGIVYVFARGLGKYFGSLIGSLSVKAEESVTKYMGLALLPQGGVSIGLSVLVRQQLPEYATAITTIIMFSILIYETTGPIFSKFAIKKAGEINGLDKYRSKKKLIEEIEADKANYIPIQEGSAGS